MANKAFYNWLTGLIDGEGSFMIQRSVYATGRRPTYQCKFRISMRSDDSEMLKEIVKELRIGYFTREHRSEFFNGGHWHKPTSAFCVSKIDDMIVLIKVLDKYPLRSKKKRDYLIWREAVMEMKRLYGKQRVDRSRIEELCISIKKVRLYQEAA